jgi:hypothetical protein
MATNIPRRLAGAGIALSAFALTPVVLASAHAVLHVGQYYVAIGWQFEPASGTVTYVDQSNAAQVFIDVPKAGNPFATPVGDLNADCTKPDFQVTVTFGTQTSSPLCPQPAFDADTGRGRMDEYDVVLTPTRVGDYKFRIFGTIHGTGIDQTVTSGPTTFDSVGDQNSTEFPAAVPALSDLNTKLDQVSTRANDAKTAAANAATAATRAGNSSSGASTLAIVALVVAVLLGAANLLLGVRRRRA